MRARTGTGGALTKTAVLLLGAGLVLFCFSRDAAAQDNPYRVTAVRTEAPIVIDGNLDEPEWDQAGVVDRFVQQEPQSGEPSSERTELRLLYDAENLYLGVYCFDSSGPAGVVVSNLSRDFPPRENDQFTFVFDPFMDKRNAYTFSINPGGAKRDGQVFGDGETRNYDWDTAWYVESRITEEGWQAEIAIPFRSLRFRDDENQVWGVNFSRRIRRKNETTHWSPVPLPYQTNRVSLAGELHGLSGIGQGRNMYIKPYVLAPVVRRQGDDVDFNPDAGVDFKYALTPGLPLDVTVNTDFSQVEADQQQINLTRFPLFFPEKREFFLENADTFRVRRVGTSTRDSRDLLAFFSRRIGLAEGRQVPILTGARVTGRAGAYRVGFLSIQTDDFEDLPSTNFSVARVQRDIFFNSEVGGIFVNKQGGGVSNRTYGVDNHLRFYNYLNISSFLLKTETEGLSGSDLAASAFLGWISPGYDIQAEYISIEENFNPEAGFVPRRDMRKSRGEFNYKFRPETIPWIREIRPSTGITYISDQDNVMESKDFDQALAVDFTDGATFSLTRRVRFERLKEPFSILFNQDIPVGDYLFNEISTRLASDGSRMFSGSVSFGSGEFFDGRQKSYQLGFRVQPVQQFSANITWSRDDVELPSGKFSTDLVTARLDYSFSLRLRLNALIQYNSTRREVASNIRFNFMHQALSDFFLVYNERRSTTGEVNERALIAKLTYLFRL